MKTDSKLSAGLFFSYRWAGGLGNFDIFKNEANSAGHAFCFSGLGEDADAPANRMCCSVSVWSLSRFRHYHDGEENRGIGRLRRPRKLLSKRDR